MKVLGIETTCDETAASVVIDGKQILSNVIATQIPMHTKYGGVIPELASREHSMKIIPVIDQALSEANTILSEIDLIAVANGPGLIGPLLIGLTTAKALSLSLQIPFVGVNHIKAHIYAAFMGNDSIKLPALGLIVSGGHTALVEIISPDEIYLISQTADDAIGEAFDKVAKNLGLPYPGGPHIEKLAKQGNPKAFSFSCGQVKKDPLMFSFSGLKTAVVYTLRDLEQSNKPIPKEDIAASFQHVAFNDLILKTKRALAKCNYKSILFGGGVTNSLKLREMFNESNFGIDLYWPERNLTLDNGAMIAGLGYQQYLTQGPDDFNLKPSPRIPFLKRNH